MRENIAEARYALEEKPLFATAAERILILNELKSAYKDLPFPLRFSKILSILLSKVSVPIEKIDRIAGRCPDRLLNETEEKLFREYISHPDFLSNTLFFSSGHCTYSWDMVLEEGLVGLREKAALKLESEQNADKLAFLTAMVEVYDAIIAYTLRYAKAAEEKGMQKLAQTLHLAATTRPDSFVVALQLLWIITLINCAYISENPTLTVGRLDMLLYPYYSADIQKGVLTNEEAKELIIDYYCKHNLIMGRGEHQVGDAANSTTFQRLTNFDAPQYMLLAGVDENGELVANELSELFAECIVPAFKNPVVVVRYVEGMDKKAPRLWKLLCDRALQSSSMMFYNDNDVIATFKRMGLSEKNARKYAHFGCNWCSPGDNGGWMAGGPHSWFFCAYASDEEAKALNVPYMRCNSEHSWPEDFVEILRTLSERENVTIEDFYEAFFERMAKFLDRKLSVLERELLVRQRREAAVMTFGDCFLRDSVEKVACYAAGATYHFELQAFQMFGTVTDCFIAVDSLVMKQKRLSLKRLLEAVEANFEGYADVLALCRNAEKYGMDTPLSNYHAKRLSHTASALVIEKNKPYFEKHGLFLVPCIQSDTWHLKMGETFGATPDGRLAHTPFSQNTRPSNGACTNGLTAMFNAMLNLPHDGLVSGALNLDVEARQFEGEDGEKRFSALLSSYFNQGGLHAQVSCVRADDLIDAQKNPAVHKDLRVRVTGYSGIFVDMCERLQNDIIQRFK